ncbi:vignain-like [Trifolium medium]|uniref:Vignain-like n=1 Tax=Trifolium medium TaxID=97028 RepID=A0A392M911_9FABA|nr:vignain-like [Trifolium medium]
MDDAFKFIIQNNGISTEAGYPYQGVDGTCKANEASTPAATITGYEDVPANNENALEKAVANQPISVAIDASGSTSSFTKVVFSLVHAVLSWIMESLLWVMVLVMMVPNIGWLKTPGEQIGGKKDTLGCKGV